MDDMFFCQICLFLVGQCESINFLLNKPWNSIITLAH